MYYYNNPTQPLLQPQVKEAEYNLGKAKTNFENYRRHPNWRMKNIVELDKYIQDIKLTRDNLGLRNHYSDEEIVEKALDFYETMPNREVDDTKRAKDKYEDIYPSKTKIANTQNKKKLKGIKHQDALKIWLSNNQEASNTHLHLVFSRKADAKRVLHNNPGMLTEILSGKTDISRGAGFIHEATLNDLESQKYRALCNYLRTGNKLKTFSTDWCFDGRLFAAWEPFSTGENSGWIEEIDFSIELLRKSVKFKAREQPTTIIQQFQLEDNKKIYEDQLEQISKVYNLVDFLDCISANPHTKSKVRKFDISGNNLSKVEDSLALCRFIHGSNLIYLNLSGCIIEVECIDYLAEALSHCTKLECVEFDRLMSYQLIEDKRSLWSKILNVTTGEPFEVKGRPRSISDGDGAKLLRALEGSKQSLIKISMCGGIKNKITKKITAPLEFPEKLKKCEAVLDYLISETIPKDCKAAGNLSEECGNILYEKIFHYPKLMSFDFSFHEFPTSVIANIVMELKNSQIAVAKLHGNTDKQVGKFPHWCCPGSYKHKLYILPSKDVMLEIALRTMMNLGLSDEREVIRRMYDAYVNSKTTGIQEYNNQMAELEKQRQKKIDEDLLATKQAEEENHKKKVEVAAAGASKQIIIGNNVNSRLLEL